MSILLYANQYITTTLSVAGGINDSTTTGIVLASTASIDCAKPGMALVTYADPLDTSVAEWIEYTSINSSTKALQGVTRGCEGFSAKSHSNGAAIAFPLTESHINRIVSRLNGDVVNGVNYVQQTDAATGNAPVISATGNDENIGLIIRPKGTGSILIQEGGVNPWRTITLNAGVFKPTTTAGCASVTTVEAGTNDIDYDVIDFDKATDENAFCNIPMPDSYDGGVIQFQFIWTAAAGTAAQTVVMELSGRSLANDDAVDQAVGTAVEVSDALIATGDVHISDWSGDVTLAGTPAGGQWWHLELMRDVSEDNLDADARIIAVKIRYKQAKFSD